VTKRKGDFRSKIDNILSEGYEQLPTTAAAPVTTETKTDKIETAKIFLPDGRKPDQDVSELLSSVRSRGVLQPLLLRPVGKRFEVVDGARRLVAAQRTGRKTVPAVVRRLSLSERDAIASKDRPLVARSTPASRAAAAGALAATAAAASASAATTRPAKPAAKTVTASKAKAVRAATGKPAAKAPARAAAKAPAATAAKAAAVAAAAATAAKPAVPEAPASVAAPVPEGPVRPAASGRARRATAARPASRTGRSAGVRIFGEAAPAAAEAATALRPAATGAPARAASARVSFPRLPEIEESGRVAAASATPTATLSDSEPRLSRSRAMAGWYIFLAVLAVASFSLTNLAINHDTTLSVESGAVAGVGLVAVVILLVTGQ
jgi:ParB/RepB/Spo0J family partition protein